MEEGHTVIMDKNTTVIDISFTVTKQTVSKTIRKKQVTEKGTNDHAEY